MNKALYIAEVIESHLTHAIAECWNWNVIPPFGSLVIIEQADLNIVACVTNIETGSADPSRQPHAYQKTEVELQQEQPQIFAFLRTKIQLTTIGFYTKKEHTIRTFLPPQPAKIHAFVQAAPATVAQQILEHADFLHLLQHAQPITYDEVLLALINHFQSSNILNMEMVQTLVTRYTMLAGSDYRRVRFFCERISSVA